MQLQKVSEFLEIERRILCEFCFITFIKVLKNKTKKKPLSRMNKCKGLREWGRTFLAVQWVRLGASTAGSADSIPGW